MDTTLNITSGSVTDRGLSEKRPENEDSFLEIRESGIFAVADGVGGAQAGEVASQMAMEILAEAFTNFPEGTDAETVLRAAIERSNTAIFQMAYELPQLKNMATTLVALHLDENIATIGHVGDSRLYRVDRSGILYRETADHSMVAEEVRAGRMTEEQAESHPSRNVISRALGAEPTVEPDLKTIMIEPGTTFLICSDGITRHVGDEEIKGVLTFGGDPVEICDYLKRLCYERGAEDNLTAVVIKVAQEPLAVNGNLSEDGANSGEESTIATTRDSVEQSSDAADADNELLELDTADLLDHREHIEPFVDEIGQRTEPFIDVAELTVDDGHLESPHELPIVPVPVAAAETREILTPPVSESDPRTENFSMFGETVSDGGMADESDHSLRKIATTVITLLIGSLVGLAAYHFLLAAPPATQNQPPLTEMQSSNQQLSAFEENRRTVDKMPAEALARFGTDPRDAEDYYLVGRAQLLLAQYDQARGSFIASRSRIAAGDVDKNNQRTIETDIAIAFAVLNDTTVRTILQSQLTPQNPNADANSNSAVGR